ncbi:hypothetical protein [Kitasatospora sp. HPMI-4]|uniref:hypothetical protein n=1 Tax=Kitasatospora sp. HPMI-4 TaxID=3448443 RepID=UPI003F1CC4C4
MNEFRSTLSEELSDSDPPPLGDLVGAAIRHGRRARRIRTVGAVAGSAVALTAVAALVGGLPGTTATPTGPGAATASKGSAPAGAPPATVPATPAALLQAALNALPQGTKTEHYAGNPVDTADNQNPSAEFYVRTEKGLGMVRVLLFDGTGDRRGCDTSTDRPGDQRTDQCFTNARGEDVYLSHPGNGVQDTSVVVLHSDGTGVQVSLGSRLEWNGATNPQGVTPLTDDQAVALAGDPALSLTMAPDFVTAANTHFAALPAFH